MTSILIILTAIILTVVFAVISLIAWIGISLAENYNSIKEISAKIKNKFKRGTAK